MDPTYFTHLQTLLEHCLVADTNVIKQATAELNTKFYKDPQCIPALYQVLATHTDAGVRQLAGTELRKRVFAKDGKLWHSLPSNYREDIKRGLLAERLLSESSRPVRQAIARAISAIADFELSPNTSGPTSSKNPVNGTVNGWPDLLPFLSQTTQAPSADHREIALFVLFTLLETVHDVFLEQFFDGLFTVFARALGDQAEPVRVVTMRALGKVAEYIEEDQKLLVRRYQELMPAMLAVLQQTVVSDNVEGCKHCFDVFETCLILETPLISRHVPEYVETCLVAAGKQDAEEEIRNAALNSLSWTVSYKKGKVQSLGLAPTIIERLLPLGCEDDHEDDDEDAPAKLAFRCLDELAKALPPSQVFPALSAQLQRYMSSGDPRMKKAALMAFGVTVEGCSEFIRPHVNQLWPWIDEGLTDPNPIVRKAGCIALACLCEWLQDECAERHEQLVPVLFNLIADPATQRAATACLEAYLEILGDKIAAYLELLMTRLLGLLEDAPVNVKITVTGAIGSAAFASKEAFIPYFGETVQRVVKFLTLTGDGDEASLRGTTLDTLGTFAETVGKDTFRPYFPELMQFAISTGLAAEEARMKESALLFFGTMASVFEDEFAPYLPQVMPALLESCRQSESSGDADDTTHSDPQAAVAAFNAATSSAKISADGDDDDDDEDIDELDALFGGVSSEIAIEKEISGEVIGQVFEATREACAPFLDESITVLLDMLEHYYEGIRKAAITSLLTILKTYYEMSGPEDWRAASPVPPLASNVEQMADMVVSRVVEVWQREDDKQVCILLCSAFSDCLNACGPQILGAHKKDVLDIIALLLKQQHDCQTMSLDEDAEGEDGGESSEYESVLISNAVDLVSTLASVYGPSFRAEFAVFLPLVAKYTEASRSSGERAMVLGALGECITGLKSGITEFTQPLLVMLSRALLQDQEPDVRSNAAFASGVLVEHSQVDLTSQFPALWAALKPAFQVADGEACTKDQGNARDNAVGCVSRLITKSSSASTSALPLVDDVLPTLVRSLPLRHDALEKRATYTALFTLFEHQSSVVLPYVDTLLAVFAHDLAQERVDELPEETRERLKMLIGALYQQVPDKVRAAGLAQ